MPRFDPALLPPLPSASETLLLEDPEQPALAAQECRVTLLVMGGSTQALAILEMARALEGRFVDGEERIPDPGRGHVPVTRALCYRVAQLLITDRSEEPFTPEQWVMLAHRAPAAFTSVCELYNRLDAAANPQPAAPPEGDEGDEGVPGPLGND